MIDSAEACQRLAALRQQLHSEADIAAEHGLSPVSFAIYELLDQCPEAPPLYRTSLDAATKESALRPIKLDKIENPCTAVRS